MCTTIQICIIFDFKMTTMHFDPRQRLPLKPTRFQSSDD